MPRICRFWLAITNQQQDLGSCALLVTSSLEGGYSLNRYLVKKLPTRKTGENSENIANMKNADNHAELLQIKGVLQ